MEKAVKNVGIERTPRPSSLPRPTITKYYLSYYLNLQNRV